MLSQRFCKVIAVVSSFSLAGCTASPFQQLNGPVPADIIDYMQLFQPFATTSISSGADYVWAGYSYVDHHCNAFFSALELGRMQAAFARDVTSSGFGAANTIMTLLQESQKSIGIVGAIGTFAQGTITSFSNNFYFAQFSGVAEHAGLLWLQVTVAQNTYKFTTVAPLYDEIKGSTIASVEVRAKAHNIVQNYARLCSLQQLQVFIHTALTSKGATPAAPPGTVAGRSREGAPLGSGVGRVAPSMPAFIIR